MPPQPLHSARWLAIFVAYFCGFSSSHRVELLNTAVQKVELKWDVRSMYDTDTWNEETYAGVNNSNQRAYVSCAIHEQQVDNWLFTPVKDSGDAKRIHISTNFSLRDCSTYTAKFCKETFGLYYKLIPKGKSDSEDHFDASEWRLLSMLTGKERDAANGLSRNEEVHTVVANGSNVRFAFRDSGACVSVLSVRVYYDVCSAETLRFAAYPETVTAAHALDTIDVKGRCVENAEPLREGIPPSAMCRADGIWKVSNEAGCQCKPGYFSSSNRSCAACSAHTFKPKAGEGECRKCPNFSASVMGAAHCECLPGYFRALREDHSHPCSKPPSKPGRPRLIDVGQNMVFLDWEEPSSLGGRRDVWYRWECPNCPKMTRATPADAKLIGRQLRLEGLEANSAYSLMIYAINEVSQFAPAQSAYSLLEFKTLPLGAHTVTDLLVEVEQKDGVTISWHPPAVARGGVEYEVEIRTNSTTHVHPIRENYFNAVNLHPGLRYEFRVRANVDGWGEWSAPLVYDQTHGKPSEVSPSERHENWQRGMTDVPIWVLSLLILAIVVVLMFMVVVCRRRTINRKQMSDLDVLDTYKQDTMTPDYPSALRGFPQTNSCFGNTPGKVNAPLIPSYGSSTPKTPHYGSRFKPYVDPTTYEDPNQALTEFTYDIDPQAVYITSVIGGGEFGDVCMGHLDRAVIGGRGEKEIETVAIKTLKPGSSPKAKADFLLEASIMGQFAHPNVIRLVGVVTRSEPVMIVTEYMSNGSLDNFLRGRDARGDDLGLPRLVEMLRGIAAGMKYLTDKGYVHRDLAARNVLVEASLVCKIADFGLSRGVDNTAEQEYTTNGGKIPVRWTAPEAITHRKFTAASDVWSFGVLMWEVMSMGERPYWEWTNQKVISEIMLGYRLPAPMDTPPALHRLMLWCWKLERHERPSFSQLLAVLERYARNPELVHADAPRTAHSMHNLSSAGYASGSGSNSSRETPPPPHSQPPLGPPSADDFLRSIGLAHCVDRLHQEGVHTVHDLARLHHLDYLAFGMISEEYQLIRDALAVYPQQARLSVQTHTLPHRVAAARTASSTLARTAHDNGFFV